jgi:hypothetical protein
MTASRTTSARPAAAWVSAALLGVAAASLLASHPHANAAEPLEVHGSADAYAATGIALAWAVLRGTDEATTLVVVRIAADPKMYPFVALTGVDPFTQGRQPLLSATESTGMLEARSPRSRFADFPRSELRLYASRESMQTDTPALIVFYQGLPDTTPEFATEAKLDAYLTDRLRRIGDGARTGGKAP